MSKVKKVRVWMIESVGAYSSRGGKTLEEQFPGIKRRAPRCSTGNDNGWGPSYVNTSVVLHFVYSGMVEEDLVPGIVGKQLYSEGYTDKAEFEKAWANLKKQAKQFSNKMRKYQNA